MAKKTSGQKRPARVVGAREAAAREQEQSLRRALRLERRIKSLAKQLDHAIATAELERLGVAASIVRGTGYAVVKQSTVETVNVN